MPACDPVQERFTDIVRRVLAGDTADLARLCTALGASVTCGPEVLTVRYPTLCVGVPLKGGTTETTVQAGTALFGPYWALLPWMSAAMASLQREATAAARVKRLEKAARRSAT